MSVGQEASLRGARTVGVGLIGYGLGGAVFHAPLIAAAARLQLRAVATSRHTEVAQALPGALPVTDLQAIFDDPAIGLVVITTPNTTHVDLARRALAAGKHVVIDKPMTTTSADADALIALAAERGRLLSVYQNRRYDGDFRTVSACIAGGRVGTVYAYEAHYDRFRPAIKPGWREVAEPGSGVLFDLGAHLIDQALTLFGMPDSIVADVIAQRPGAEVDDYFTLTLGYAKRRAVLRASTLVCEPGPRFAVHGDAGSFVKFGFDPQEAALRAGISPHAHRFGDDAPGQYGTLTAEDGRREVIPTLPGSYLAFYDEMAAAILDAAPLPVEPRAGRDVIAVIELAQRSVREGRAIRLTP